MTTELDRTIKEISALQTSADPLHRKQGRAALVAASRKYGHQAIEEAQARAGLLPPDHMAHWAVFDNAEDPSSI